MIRLLVSIVDKLENMFLPTTTKLWLYYSGTTLVLPRVQRIKTPSTQLVVIIIAKNTYVYVIDTIALMCEFKPTHNFMHLMGVAHRLFQHR